MQNPYDRSQDDLVLLGSVDEAWAKSDFFDSARFITLNLNDDCWRNRW
jgi:hypothetical protein